MNAVSDADRRECLKLEIREEDGCKGVFASEDILKNSAFKLGGAVSSRPDRHSLQLGEQRHLHVPADMNETEHPEFFWRYLNHSCQPNGFINTAELTFVALRKISKGEECTFNYLTTEVEMAAPFTCRCGAVTCFGLIQGSAHLCGGQEEEDFSIIHG